ncbi:hypothetical protein HPB52_000794 [Rhipicephalus sanguineus]|uniref:Uncharacterized protein n=1 Tax=Rhipicephalus sanguineus TaxID=34632 RepID=A0A9D4SV94_RHISA|nr:hypothetical protein HPB52_000794 [Rhipicephalus sanguineus]
MGVSPVVQIDECLMSGRHQANRGRFLTDDNVPPSRRNTYSGVHEGAEAVRRRQETRPPSTLMNLDWHSVNCTDPTTGASTQCIESEWQKAKATTRLERQQNDSNLLRSHLTWLWWRCLNARPDVKEKFLGLMEAHTRRCSI